MLNYYFGQYWLENHSVMENDRYIKICKSGQNTEKDKLKHRENLMYDDKLKEGS